MASHFPINHHLRPLYRLLSAVAGLYMLVFGVVGFVQTSGKPFFDRDQAEWVLGLRADPGFAVLWIVLGALVLGANLVGRNLAHQVNQFVGVLLLLIGTASLALLQTDANVLAFSMVNVIVTYILGCLIGTASLYDRVGSANDASSEERLRHVRA